MCGGSTVNIPAQPHSIMGAAGAIWASEKGELRFSDITNIAVSLSPALPSMLPLKREGEGPLIYSDGENLNRREEASADQLTVAR